MTLVEVKKSPRPEIIEKKDAIIRYIKRNGLKVGPSYLKLVGGLEHVPDDRRDDAAIALAASDNLPVDYGCLVSSVPSSAGTNSDIPSSENIGERWVLCGRRRI
ncbi:MAG: hypothetical protein F7B17_03130 [Desulfurococcales archaeon]|nr:hypothetical protein [Desulfurococcales archaeon]